MSVFFLFEAEQKRKTADVALYHVSIKFHLAVEFLEIITREFRI